MWGGRCACLSMVDFLCVDEHLCASVTKWTFYYKEVVVVRSKIGLSTSVPPRGLLSVVPSEWKG